MQHQLHFQPAHIYHGVLSFLAKPIVRSGIRPLEIGSARVSFFQRVIQHLGQVTDCLKVEIACISLAQLSATSRWTIGNEVHPARKESAVSTRFQDREPKMFNLESDKGMEQV